MKAKQLYEVEKDKKACKVAEKKTEKVAGCLYRAYNFSDYAEKENPAVQSLLRTLV